MINTAISRIRNLIKYGSYVPTDFYTFENKKLVYLSIPKVACTSIKIATMASNENDNNYDSYMNIHSVAERFHHASLSKTQEAYFKFAFVRNPFDRLISCYEDKVKKPAQHNGKYFFDTGYNNKIINGLFRDKFSPEMTFPEFIRQISKIPDWLSDGHFRSQHSMLYKNGKLNVDYVGKFETLTDDWKPIAEKFNFPDLSMKNASTRRDYSDYYTSNEIIEQVMTRYHDDIVSFNYIDNYDKIKEQLRLK